MVRQSCDPQTFDEAKACPSKITRRRRPLFEILPLNKLQLASLKTEIDNRKGKIDGGDRDKLIDLIRNGNKGETRNELLKTSPYLSDMVLIEYLTSNPPSSDIRQIVIANSPVSDRVMEVLKQQDLPRGVETQIRKEQHGESERTILKREIAMYERERSHLLDETIQAIVFDTVVENRMDLVIDLLVKEEDRIRREELCDAYLCKDDKEKFVQERDKIEQKHGSDNFVRIAKINGEITKNGTIAIDPEEVDIDAIETELEEIAADPFDRMNAARANALLPLFNGKLDQPVVESLIKELDTGKSGTFVNEEKEAYPALMALFPNPTKGGMVTIQVEEGAFDAPYVDVIDVTGKHIASYTFSADQTALKMNTTGLVPGMYIVKLIDNEQLKETHKLIISQ